MRKTEIENFYEGRVMVNDNGWREMNKSEKKEALEKELREIESAEKKEPRRCKNCGKPIEFSFYSFYCSEECRKKSIKLREKRLNLLNEGERPKNPSINRLKEKILRKK